MLERIRTGEATAADMGVARQLLKDNGIDAIPVEGSPPDDLNKTLPFPNAAGVMAEDSDMRALMPTLRMLAKILLEVIRELQIGLPIQAISEARKAASLAAIEWRHVEPVQKARTYA